MLCRHGWALRGGEGRAGGQKSAGWPGRSQMSRIHDRIRYKSENDLQLIKKDVVVMPIDASGVLVVRSGRWNLRR